MNTVVWVVAYTNKSCTNVMGYINNPDYFFTSQEKADAAKAAVFEQLQEQGLVEAENQLRAIPMSELDVSE